MVRFIFFASPNKRNYQKMNEIKYFQNNKNQTEKIVSVRTVFTERTHTESQFSKSPWSIITGNHHKNTCNMFHYMQISGMIEYHQNREMAKWMKNSNEKPKPCKSTHTHKREKSANKTLNLFLLNEAIYSDSDKLIVRIAWPLNIWFSFVIMIKISSTLRALLYFIQSDSNPHGIIDKMLTYFIPNYFDRSE